MTRRSLWAGAIFAVVLGVYVASPVGQELDSFRVNAVAQQVLDHDTVSLAGTDTHGLNWIDPVAGQPYPRYPLGESFVALPFVAGADLAGFPPDTAARDQRLQIIEASVITAAAAAVMFLIAELGLGVLQPRRRRLWAAGVALVFAFGTAAWSTASRAMWQHGPSMLLLAVAAYLALRSREHPRLVAWMGLPLGAAYWMRPTDSIPIVVLSLWVLVCHRRQLVGYLAGLGAMLGLFALVSEVAYHSLLPSYYATGSLSRFSFGVAGLAGELVSPARGLLVFSPVVVLAVAGVVIARRRRVLDGFSVALVAIVVVHWLTVASTADWWGGSSYGARYMSDMLPFLVVLALPAVAWLAQREPGREAAMAGVAVLVAASVAFNAGGALSARGMEWNSDVPYGVSRLWSWSDPQFLRGLPFAGYAPLFAVLAFVGVATALAVSLRQPAAEERAVGLGV